MVLSALNRFDINAITKMQSLLHSQYLKLFSKKILRIFRLLLIISRENLEEIPNIN